MVPDRSAACLYACEIPPLARGRALALRSTKEQRSVIQQRNTCGEHPFSKPEQGSWPASSRESRVRLAPTLAWVNYWLQCRNEGILRRSARSAPLPQFALSTAHLAPS